MARTLKTYAGGFSVSETLVSVALIVSAFLGIFNLFPMGYSSAKMDLTSRIRRYTLRYIGSTIF